MAEKSSSGYSGKVRALSVRISLTTRDIGFKAAQKGKTAEEFLMQRLYWVHDYFKPWLAALGKKVKYQFSIECTPRYLGEEFGDPHGTREHLEAQDLAAHDNWHLQGFVKSYRELLPWQKPKQFIDQVRALGDCIEWTSESMFDVKPVHAGGAIAQYTCKTGDRSFCKLPDNPIRGPEEFSAEWLKMDALKDVFARQKRKPQAIKATTACRHIDKYVRNNDPDERKSIFIAGDVGQGKTQLIKYLRQNYVVAHFAARGEVKDMQQSIHDSLAKHDFKVNFLIAELTFTASDSKSFRPENLHVVLEEIKSDIIASVKHKNHEVDISECVPWVIIFANKWLRDHVGKRLECWQLCAEFDGEGKFVDNFFLFDPTIPGKLGFLEPTRKRGRPPSESSSTDAGSKSSSASSSDPAPMDVQQTGKSSGVIEPVNKKPRYVQFPDKRDLYDLEKRKFETEDERIERMSAEMSD